MKNRIALILSCILLMAFMPVQAEETSLTGVWYADLDGIPIAMNLNEDGGYSLQFPGEEPVDGTWEEQEGGFICLDGEEPPEVLILGDKLKWADSMVFFGREQDSNYYQPAEVNGELPGELYAGYWQCAFVDVGGTAVPAMTMHDRTDLYIEGNSVILGGPAFRDVLVRMTFENGGLNGENEGAAVKLEMQADAFLRMTVTGEDGSVETRYLLPGYSEFLATEE